MEKEEAMEILMLTDESDLDAVSHEKNRFLIFRKDLPVGYTPKKSIKWTDLRQSRHHKMSHAFVKVMNALRRAAGNFFTPWGFGYRGKDYTTLKSNLDSLARQLGGVSREDFEQACRELEDWEDYIFTVDTSGYNNKIRWNKNKGEGYPPNAKRTWPQTQRRYTGKKKALAENQFHIIGNLLPFVDYLYSKVDDNRYESKKATNEQYVSNIKDMAKAIKTEYNHVMWGIRDSLEKLGCEFGPKFCYLSPKFSEQYNNGEPVSKRIHSDIKTLTEDMVTKALVPSGTFSNGYRFRLHTPGWAEKLLATPIISEFDSYMRKVGEDKAWKENFPDWNRYYTAGQSELYDSIMEMLKTRSGIPGGEVCLRWPEFTMEPLTKPTPLDLKSKLDKCSDTRQRAAVFVEFILNWKELLVLPYPDVYADGVTQRYSMYSNKDYRRLTTDLRDAMTEINTHRIILIEMIQSYNSSINYIQRILKNNL